MRILGIDSSTKTGVAVIDTDAAEPIVYTEQIHFDKLDGWERVSAIAARCLEVYSAYGCQAVVKENYGFGNAHTLATLVEIGSIIRYFMWQENIPYLVVPPTTVKQYTTGKGNSKKEMMILEVFKRWNYTAETNDIADAIALGMIGRAITNEKWTVAEKGYIAKVLKGQPKFAASIKRLKAQCN